MFPTSVAAGSGQNPQIELGQKNQLLIDGYCIGSIKNLHRVLYQPDRYPANLIFTGNESQGTLDGFIRWQDDSSRSGNTMY